MRSSRFVFASVAILTGCALHSGSGLDPNEVIHPDAGEGADDGGSSSSSGSDEGGASGSSSGSMTGSSSGATGSGSGGGSGTGFPDACVGPCDGNDSGAGSPDVGADSNPIDQGCASNPSNCGQCCQASYSQGYMFYTADLRACLCGDSNPCAGACPANEFCNNGMFNTPGDACEQCATKQAGAGGQCSQVQSACTGNPTCSGYLGCANGCPGGPG